MGNGGGRFEEPACPRSGGAEKGNVAFEFAPERPKHPDIFEWLSPTPHPTPSISGPRRGLMPPGGVSPQLGAL